MVVQASKLILPRSSLLSSPQISSLLFEPHSLSLALMHSDSSFSLYPSISPLSIPPLSPPPPTFIPSPSSSAFFLLLQNRNPNSEGNPSVLFVVAGPYEGGASLLLRFWILRKKPQVFARANVVSAQSNLRSKDGLGVVMNVRLGVSIKLSGSTNYFAMYSISDSKIWVFAVKMVGDDDGGGNGVVLKVMKCAVIECTVPVWSISISFGLLILGEEKGVRVLPLRLLVKGRARKQRRENRSSKSSLENVKVVRVPKLPNGVVQNNDLFLNYALNDLRGERIGVEGKAEILSNGYLERKSDAHGFSVKFRTLKLGQDLGQGNEYFVSFKAKEVGSSNIAAIPISERVISIQALSANKFLILDSVGDLHLLCLSNMTFQSELTFHVRQLTHIMKVHKLAVLTDSSTKNQIVWLSDGLYSVHIMTLSDSEISLNENDRSESKEKQMQTSVTQVIFTSEKIQDVVPLAADAILILGEGDIFVYAVS